MRSATIVLTAVLLLGGCGHAVQQTAPDRLRVTTPAATVDPQIQSLRAQLAQARAERDAALARLHALERHRPAVVHIVVRERSAASTGSAGSGQPITQVFSNVSTASSP